MKRKLPAFDVLVDMARNHPERLELLRTRLSQNIIDNAATDQQKKRLAGLQFQVDMERERARTPLQATIRISEMMCHSLAQLHKSMVTPLADDSDPVAVAAAGAADTNLGSNVIAFRSRQKENETEESEE